MFKEQQFPVYLPHLADAIAFVCSWDWAQNIRVLTKEDKSTDSKKESMTPILFSSNLCFEITLAQSFKLQLKN